MFQIREIQDISLSFSLGKRNSKFLNELHQAGDQFARRLQTPDLSFYIPAEFLFQGKYYLFDLIA